MAAGGDRPTNRPVPLYAPFCRHAALLRRPEPALRAEDPPGPIGPACLPVNAQAQPLHETIKEHTDDLYKDSR
eukprot:11258812-Heterocapsa_arctica.AAC.1